MAKKKAKKATAKAKAKPKTKAKSKAKKASRPKKVAQKAKKSAAKTKTKSAGQKSTKPKMTVIAPPNSTLLGRVEDFFAHINVIALTLQKPVTVGSRLHILGHTTNLECRVDSMQIDHNTVASAGPRDEVGIKVPSRVRRRDYVFLIQE